MFRAFPEECLFSFCCHALLKLQNSEITCEYRLVWESEFSGVGKWAAGDFKFVLQVAVGLVLWTVKFATQPIFQVNDSLLLQMPFHSQEPILVLGASRNNFFNSKVFWFFSFWLIECIRLLNWLEKRRNYFLLEISWTKSNILKLEGPKSNLHQVSRTKNIIYHLKKIVILIASKLHFNP